MNDNLLNNRDLDLELKKLLDNIENIKADIDLYGIIVEEKIPAEAV